ncbi:MAG TPA: hypothetical protein VGS17_00850, partial [Candidatus Limnocylindria bacterium]|nr:hypothetical protein [Candidatus Limnocylindria bacterium]
MASTPGHHEAQRPVRVSVGRHEAAGRHAADRRSAPLEVSRRWAAYAAYANAIMAIGQLLTSGGDPK